MCLKQQNIADVTNTINQFDVLSIKTQKSDICLGRNDEMILK